jgi:hypothetical protein
MEIPVDFGSVDVPTKARTFRDPSSRSFGTQDDNVFGPELEFFRGQDGGGAKDSAAGEAD